MSGGKLPPRPLPGPGTPALPPPMLIASDCALGRVTRSRRTDGALPVPLGGAINNSFMLWAPYGFIIYSLESYILSSVVCL